VLLDIDDNNVGLQASPCNINNINIWNENIGQIESGSRTVGIRSETIWESTKDTFGFI